MLVKLSSSSITPLQTLNFNALKPTDNETVTVIGFGDTNTAVSSASPILLGVDIRIISVAQCNAYWGTVIQDKQVCAGIAEGGKDSCFGDSGGPLLTKNGEQVGIVSFSDGCAKANVPAVYTRISGYKDFITKGICDLSNNPPLSCSTPVTPPVPMPPTKPSAPSPTTDGPDSRPRWLRLVHIVYTMFLKIVG